MFEIDIAGVEMLSSQQSVAARQVAVANTGLGIAKADLDTALRGISNGSELTGAMAMLRDCWGNDLNDIMNKSSNVATFMDAFASACTEEEVSGVDAFQ